jgi:hypothetical protein
VLVNISLLLDIILLCHSVINQVMQTSKRQKYCVLFFLRRGIDIQSNGYSINVYTYIPLCYSERKKTYANLVIGAPRTSHCAINTDCRSRQCFLRGTLQIHKYTYTHSDEERGGEVLLLRRLFGIKWNTAAYNLNLHMNYREPDEVINGYCARSNNIQRDVYSQSTIL